MGSGSAVGGAVYSLGPQAYTVESSVGDPAEMFRQQDFYKVGLKYWERQPANDDGMLGGFLEHGEADLASSRQLLESYFVKGCGGRVADVACGIGRVACGLLHEYFDEIVLVDPVASFVEVATRGVAALGKQPVPCVCGAQDWVVEGVFRCFWLQWVLMFLTDDDCVALLRRCGGHVAPDGYIIIKDNAVLEGGPSDTIIWADDHSCARPRSYYRRLILAGGLRIVCDTVEEEDPGDEDMVPTAVFVCRPIEGLPCTGEVGSLRGDAARASGAPVE